MSISFFAGLVGLCYNKFNAYSLNKAMKPFFSVLLSLLLNALGSQEKGNYIIKTNMDTVFTQAIKLDKNRLSLICDVAGRKIKYLAGDVLLLKMDTTVFESGYVRLRRLNTKKCVFLHRIAEGKLNMYEIHVRKNRFLWPIFIDDLFHLRWVYRAHDWIKKSSVSVYYFRKENDLRESLSKNWKEKTRDCDLLQEKLSAKDSVWKPKPIEVVRFYNTKCI